MHTAHLAFMVTLPLAVAGAIGCPSRAGRTDTAAANAAVENLQGDASDCKPFDTRTSNAPSQEPAFPGQRRACAIKSDVALEVTDLAKGLDHPWAVEPLPGGDLLVTERPGRLRVVSAAGGTGEPISGLPKVDARGQGGLLDVALSPSFGSDRTIYWSYSEPRESGNGTSVARGVLSDDRLRVENVRVIFRAMPTYRGRLHFGSRVVFGPDGMLYVTLGERSDLEMRPQAQQLDSHMGKIVRIAPDGSVPRDNPFVDKPDALPEIWTLGHRNIQSAAFDSQGQFWIVEHGARGGDELNLIEKGKNYGWPIVAYGLEYSGKPLAYGAVTQRAGYEQPDYYWDPVIAPSGAELYSGDAFPDWRGSLFIGGLITESIVRLTLENNRVTGEEHLLADRKQRVRDVQEGPDGALYVVTDEDNGEIWKLMPRR